MVPRSVKLFVLLHIGISLFGVLLHGRIHPLGKSLYFWLAAPVSLFSLIVIPILYVRSSTVAWGFLLNAITVLAGTIGMSYYSLLNVEPPFTLSRIITESTLLKILFLWLKVPIAIFILRAMRPLLQSPERRGCAEP